MSTTGRWAIAVSFVAHVALVYASTWLELPEFADIDSRDPISVELLVQQPVADEIEFVTDAPVELPLPEPPPPPPTPEPSPEPVEPPVESVVETESDEEEADEEWARHTAEQRARLQIADLEIATALALARAYERIDNERRKHTFSIADLFPEEEPQDPGADRDAFASPSAGRAGLTEVNSYGQMVTWISDECYRTSGSIAPVVFHAAEDLFNIGTTNCVSTKPRRDLFEHLKRD